LNGDAFEAGEVLDFFSGMDLSPGGGVFNRQS
jgi:hypothetical protein